MAIDQDAASDLLMGIEDSTHNFADTTATADTFMAIADLMKRGARRYQAQATIGPAQFPPGSIPGSLSGMPRSQMPQGNPQPNLGFPSPFPPNQMPQMGQVPPGGFTPMQQQFSSNSGLQPQGQQMPMSRPQIQQGPSPAGTYPLPQVPPGGFTPQVQGSHPSMPQQQSRQQNSPLSQQGRQVQNSQPLPNQNDESDEQDQRFENPPEDWLSKPKVYKGTSVS